MLLLAAAAAAPLTAEPHSSHSVARQWNELQLQAIRKDYAFPTIHARNLYHVSVAMWDAWAAYDEHAQPVLADERAAADDVAAARHEAISYAAYRVLYARYLGSPGAYLTVPKFDELFDSFGYDYADFRLQGDDPAAVGNRIAKRVLDHGYDDGADELGSYAFEYDYTPVNPPLVVANPGTSGVADANRWQPLSLRLRIDQAGQRGAGSGATVRRLALGTCHAVRTRRRRSGGPRVYHDPGRPPHLGGERSAAYQEVFSEVIGYGATLTPDDGVLIDISPGAHGNNSLGANDGTGHPLNPVTGKPYAPNVVKRGDWTRVIAEFWADGPDSELPPGHWSTLANYVTDHPLLERRLGGAGPVVDPLEWDVKLYLALNGALHDAAICAWGIKGHYDYVRPITAIRRMAELGQSSDPELPAYHPQGLPLQPGLVELITAASAASASVTSTWPNSAGEVAGAGWRGKPAEPDSYGGVGWVRGVEWVPYQRDSFVTPPFAGYVSGHSTFSRAAAEVLARFTGSAFFPGGVGEFVAPVHQFLAFESGRPSRSPCSGRPTTTRPTRPRSQGCTAASIRAWTTCRAAASAPRIGSAAFERAQAYFTGTATPAAAAPDRD